MKLYEIELEQGNLSPVSHYVLAKDFRDAEAQADKLLAHFLKEWEDAEILSIVLKFEIEVVS